MTSDLHMPRDSRELLAMRDQVQDELLRLGRFDKLTGAQQDRAAELRERLDALDELLEEVEKVHAERLNAIRSAVGTGRATTINGHGLDRNDEPHRGTSTRDQAHRTIDNLTRSRLLPDYAADRAVRLVEAGPVRERDAAARWMTTAGDPHYAAAFHKIMADPERGHLTWTERERVAFAAVQETRAAALSPDSAGGYLVPAHLDPAILLTSGGSASELRQVCRVETIVGDTWNGVSSAGATAHWRAEAGEVDDDAPTLAQPSVPVHRGDAFVPFSFEVGMDAPGFAQQMGRLLRDAADQLQTAAYTTGTGVGQPTGIVTALTGTSSVVTSTTTDVFAAADVYKVMEALPPRFQANARWMASLPILNSVAKFETGAGARLFPEVGGNPPSLLRKPVHELSTLDGVINATQENYVAIYGDFSNLLIVDRVGTTVELVPHLFGVNRRPTGQRGFLMWFRTGSDSLVDNAFRMLNVT